MSGTPTIVVFDVNETLSDMSAMSTRFVDVGAPEHFAKIWFTTLLCDGFALTVAGAHEKFAVLGADALRRTLADVSLDRDLDSAVDHVMAGFAGLSVHPDVPEGVAALRAAGKRLVTLSNGSTDIADQLFRTAGIRDEFERLLSVEAVSSWKPAAVAYEYAARTCEASLSEMMLVAVHPWDIDGAARAGMQTAWINRAASEYPSYFTRPDNEVPALGELAARLENEQ